jgi:hypothetical protein
MDAAMIMVMPIHLSGPEGDILLFLAGAAGRTFQNEYLPVYCQDATNAWFEAVILGRTRHHRHADPPDRA